MRTSVFCIALLCFVSVGAYQFYQDRIPNGELVPHPCKPNYLWKGVGHLNVLGGGDRNPFGLDFAENGRKWDRRLCQMDSDGDGKTNGQELGDPFCQWSEDGGAPYSSATGHPGVCEPLDSELCKAKNAAVKEDWEFCTQGEFECDAITTPDVRNLTISISRGTPVPAKETTYMCQLVELPDDQEYHIIGTKPAIDNQIVAHHIIVYGCAASALPLLQKYTTPQECDSMLVYGSCEHGVGGWTVGQAGYCEQYNVGTRFGRRVFNYAIIEIHWNNPMEIENYRDGSGLTIFYTPNLREYDAETLTIGQQSLAIPPNVDTHYQSSVCTKDCTRSLKEPIYMYGLNLHMHYLGRAGRVEHWRNGSLMQVLADEERYSYDSPQDYQLDPPVEFWPGDELKMFCKFKSTTRSNVTYYGDGTSDEMCFAFINYYPKTGLSYCTNYGPMDTCPTRDEDPDVKMYESMKRLGCNMLQYEEMIGALAAEAAVYCVKGEDAQCNPECRRLFERKYKEEPCLRNDLRFAFEAFMMVVDKSEETKDLVDFLRVCDKLIIPAKASLEYYNKEDFVTAGAAGQSPVCLLLSVLGAMAFAMYLDK